MTQDIDISIPAFLLVKNKGKVKPPKPKKQQGQTAPVASSTLKEDLLAQLEPDLRAIVEAEIKSHRFRLHWLTDPSTIRAFIAQRDAAMIKKQEGLERLKALAAEKKAAMPPKVKVVFGSGIYIKSAKPNPRKKGTKAYGLYNEMLKWIKKHKNGSVADLFEQTGYKKNDYDWDLKRGDIVTDIIKQEKK